MFRVKNLGFLSAVSIFSVLPSGFVYAQVEQATSVADPSRVEQDLIGDVGLPELSQDAPVETSAPSLQNAPAGAENVTLVLDTLKLEGVNRYSADQLAPLYDSFLGKTITLADVYSISNAIADKYRSDGFILAQAIIPAQTIDNGEVLIRVVEGFIDKITIEGEPNARAQKRILQYADKIRDENIVDSKVLEHYLLLINDLPGVSARSVLSPSKTTVGASDLAIIIERDQYDATASFGNTGSRFLGPYQGIFSGSANSVLGFNERISGTLALSGDKDNADELLFGSVSYEQPISATGTRLRLTGSLSGTEPGADLEQFNVRGQSRFVQGTVSHPFIRSRTTNFTGRASFDFRSVKSSNDIEATRRDRIASVRLGATYQFIDTLIGVGVNAIDLELSRGVGLFGASSRNDPNLTRADGNSRYHKAELALQRLQRLTPRLNLLLAAEGQLASTPLLSSEEFGVGGSQFGRGYDPSEIVGEDGFKGKVELQWREPHKIQYLDTYRLNFFYDVGRVFNQDATTAGAARDSLASAGFYIDADITNDLNVELGVGFPLTRNVDVTDDRDPRYHFNITHRF